MKLSRVNQLILFTRHVHTKEKMRLGATVPNFKAETTEGPIQFYDWQGDS